MNLTWIDAGLLSLLFSLGSLIVQSMTRREAQEVVERQQAACVRARVGPNRVPRLDLPTLWENPRLGLPVRGTLCLSGLLPEVFSSLPRSPSRRTLCIASRSRTIRHHRSNSVREMNGFLNIGSGHLP